MQFVDSVKIAGTRVREDGYLVVDARIARANNVQRYLGSEVGKPELPFVDVFRPESEVFSPDAMASFAHRPVTDDHPREAVTKDNWKSLAVGQTDGEIKRDGDFLRVPLMVADGASIAKVESGKRELSAGYTCDLKWEKGQAPNGQTYDAVQTNIRANHVAIVARGRAGKDCRIGDADFWGSAPIHDKETKMDLRTVLVDGLSVQTTDQGAQAIEKLTRDKAAIQTQLDAANEAHAKALAAKDAELAKKDAALDDAKAKVLDQAAIDKLVADRVALEAAALKIAKDVKPAGLSDADLRRAVVKAKLGDALPADKLANDSYVAARFDILAEDAAKTPDTFRDTMRSRSPAPVGMNDAEALRQQAFDALLQYDMTGKEAN
ncbi:head scaffold protein [Pseudanabaena phage Pam3]|nr:head scaffold protein [Pseudanabaena phage Pam3]